MLNGYYQTAFGLMRDLVEIHTLLDYFTAQPEKIDRWSKVTNAERVREFRPSELRKVLDERDGFTGGGRRRDYEAFSEHASHLTYAALRMLQTPEGHTHLGPMFNPGHLRNCSVELARRVILCVLLIIRLLPNRTEDGDPRASQALLKDIDELRRLSSRLLGGSSGPGPE
jgi:hypothetical protein